MTSGPSDDHDTAAGTRRRLRLKPRPGSTVPWAALAGLLSAGAAIAVGELLSGITDRAPSLVLGVSDAIVDSRFVPGAVIRWSIDTLGSAQKPLLFYGVLAATLILGVLTGIVARRHRWVIAVVYAAFGTIGGLLTSVIATATTGMRATTERWRWSRAPDRCGHAAVIRRVAATADPTELKPRQPPPTERERARWFEPPRQASVPWRQVRGALPVGRTPRRRGKRPRQAWRTCWTLRRCAPTPAGGRQRHTGHHDRGRNTPPTVAGGPAQPPTRRHQSRQRPRRRPIEPRRTGSHPGGRQRPPDGRVRRDHADDCCGRRR